MAQATKRKHVESRSSNETSSTPRNKTRRQNQTRRQAKTKGTSKRSVEFADPSPNTVSDPVRSQLKGGSSPLDTYSNSEIARSSSKSHKSSLKTTSAPLLTAPESLNAAHPPPFKASEQPEEEEVDTEEGNTIIALAAAAMKMAEDARKERSQRDLASTGKCLENVDFYREVLLESRDLVDTRKRAETALAELKEAVLANGTLENKIKTLEAQVKRSEELIEKLQRDSAVVGEKETEIEKSLREKTAKETPEVGEGVAK